MRSARFIFFILLFLKTDIVCCQDNMPDLIFHHINERNGLSNNIINAIIKDRAGFMWIATFDGLNRFDGTHFTVFRNNRNKQNSLQHNTVFGICTDKDDNIWCATQTGISRFNKQTQDFENFLPETKKIGVTYSDVVCDAWGTIWCSSSSGIYEYLPQTKTFRNYNSSGSILHSLTNDNIGRKSMILSPDRRSVWITTLKGINQLDIQSRSIHNYKNNPGALTVFDSLPHSSPCFDPKGNLVFGNLNPYTITQFQFSTNSLNIYDILFSEKNKTRVEAAYIFADKNNQYWISTWGYTCFVFDPVTKQTKEFYNETENAYSIAGDLFRAIFEDEEGTLWLGTVNGLSHTNPDLSFLRLHRPFKNSSAQTDPHPIGRYAEDDKGNWWFSCINKEEFYQYDPVTEKLKIYSFPFDASRISDIKQFKNLLLLSTQTGLHIFNMNTGRLENFSMLSKLQRILENQPISWLRIIGDSVICASVKSSGITQFNLYTQNLRTVSIQQNDFLKRNIRYGWANILSANNQIYIFFSQLKIARYDIEQNHLDSIPIFFDRNIKLPVVQNINSSQDKDGNFWVVLNGTGLVYVDVETGQTKLLQQSDGLINNNIYESSVDDSGRIWISSFNKFSVFDPHNNGFDNFSLPISENSFAYASRLLKLSNGNILGNIEKTFVEWLPGKISKISTAQPVLINRVVVNDSSFRVFVNKTLKLRHTDNNFTIEFGLLTGIEKSRYHLQYKLEGFDAKWRDADIRNNAVYTNVPEKDFVFKVRAVSSNGNMLGTETTLFIKVIPPFYRTTWFKIIAALLLATIIAGLVRMRVNSIRNSEKEKNEFNKRINEWRLKALRSQMNPHFIFNCMNSIDLYILKNDAENASRYLNKFAKLVRLILSQSNDMFAPLDKEIEMLKYYIDLEALRFDYPFQYSITISDDLDVDETEIPTMLLQPYVENAILHGLRHKKGNCNLKIDLSRKNDHLFCVIEDDGVGRKQSAIINSTRSEKHESRGTILAEERLKVIENEKSKPVIHITDLHDANENASGTRVEISIPVEFDY